jgi:hypothetical protein
MHTCRGSTSSNQPPIDCQRCCCLPDHHITVFTQPRGDGSDYVQTFDATVTSIVEFPPSPSQPEARAHTGFKGFQYDDIIFLLVSMPAETDDFSTFDFYCPTNCCISSAVTDAVQGIYGGTMTVDCALTATAISNAAPVATAHAATVVCVAAPSTSVTTPDLTTMLFESTQGGTNFNARVFAMSIKRGEQRI